MRYITTLFSSVLFSMVLMSSASAAGKYESSYDAGDYFDAILNAGLMRALEMAEEQLREELVSVLTDPKERERLLHRLSSKAIEKIADIVNDDGKSDRAKAESVTNVIAKSMLDYDSGQVGSLDLSLRYSPQFLATEISWGRKVEHLSCDEWKVTMDCDFDSFTGFYECKYGGYYADVEYTVEPAYKIYRVVNGNRKLMTRINGQRLPGKVSWSTKPSEWVNQIKNLLESSDNRYAGLGRAVHYDFDGDIREKGATLSYVVEADPSSVWNESTFCDSARSYGSTADFDSNGDGYADFIPKSGYSLPDLSVSIELPVPSGEVKSIIENKGDEKADVAFEFFGGIGTFTTKSVSLSRKNGSCERNGDRVKCRYLGLEPGGILEVLVVGSQNGWAEFTASVDSVNRDHTSHIISFGNLGIW